MIQVGKISLETANNIRGELFNSGIIFNPVQDFYNNWVVSIHETQFLDPSEYEIIDFEPKPAPEN